MTGPMIDTANQPAPYGAAAPTRDATAVMGRRILAWVLDILLYLGLSLALFASLAEYVEIPESAAVSDACELARAGDPTGDLVSSCVDVSEIPIEGMEGRVFITSSDDNNVQALASLGYLVFFVVIQGVTGGSPGKLLTGLRVVDEQGNRAGVAKSLGRTLLWVVDGAPWFVPLVGFIVGLTSTGHRRVGDIVAKTYVVSARDRGRPVAPHQAAAPAGAQAWGAPAPTPSWQDPAQVLPAGRPAAPPMRDPGAEPRGRTTGPPPGQPVDPAVPESVVPHISGVPGDNPAPPSTAGISAPPEWRDPTGGMGAPPGEPPPDEAPPVDQPTAESTTPADEATPHVTVDPDWWRGPEAAGAAELADDGEPARREGEPEGVEWQDPSPGAGSPAPPAEEPWAPPTTPNADFDITDDASPTAGPTPFVAPGTDPRVESPSTPQANPMPPPQWDQARNTYIQWDPNQQMWLQWDTVANRWKLIDT